jgi:hypothetical protein
MSVERKHHRSFNKSGDLYGSSTSLGNSNGFSVKYHKVEKAREFEQYRQLPKYSHISLAVIHPSPIKKLPPAREVSPQIIVAAHPAKLQYKKYEKKQIPDHLMRAPMDSFTSSPVSRGGGGGGGSKGRSKSGKRGSKPVAGANTEGKRAKRAEANRKVLFVEIKKILDKAEEAATAPGSTTMDPVVLKGYNTTTLSKCREDLINKVLL